MGKTNFKLRGVLLTQVNLIIIFMLPCFVSAATTVVDVNTLVSSGDVYDVLVAEGPDAVIDIQGGTINELVLVDSVQAVITGGSVSTVVAFDSTELDISGGNISDVATYDQVSVNISGNASISSVGQYGTNQISIEGNASITNLHSGKNGRLLISFATVPTTWIRLTVAAESFVRAENARLRIEGVDGIQEGGALVVKGCFIEATTNDFSWPVVVNGDIYFSDCHINFAHFNISGKLHFIGQNLAVRPYGGTWDKGQVTGQWEDLTVFAVSLPGRDDYVDVVLHEDGSLPYSSPPATDLTQDFKVDLQDLMKLTDDWLVDSTVPSTP